MYPTTEIQVFVSNPKDVDLEKSLIKNICLRINSRLSTTTCNVRYLVKDWSQVIGKFGPNPQTEIESVLGPYDIYLGIWWKKFGSNTGLVNPETNEDYGSGTYREFSQAYVHWKVKQKPEIYLFFKKQLSEDLFDIRVNSEFGKILEFEKEQQPNGFCNTFSSDREFE